MNVPQTAAALVIGNEILSGKVQERNLTVLARTLRVLGIRLRCVVIVEDVIDTIVDQIQSLSAAHDVVFTSGGVGPTHDDVTIQAAAKAFGRQVVVDPNIEAMIHAYFGDRTCPGHLLMARIPEGCELISSPQVRWPTVKLGNVWLLPGVPEVFALKLRVVRSHLTTGLPFVSRSVMTTVDEAALIAVFDALVQRFPNVLIGSYPKWKDPTCRTEVTFDSTDADAVHAACAAFVEQLPAGEPVKVV